MIRHADFPHDFESLVPRNWPRMSSSSFVNPKLLSTHWSNSRMIIQTGVPTTPASVACCRDRSQSRIVPIMKYRITCQVFLSASRLCRQTLLRNSWVVGSNTLRNPFRNPYPEFIIFVLRRRVWTRVFQRPPSSRDWARRIVLLNLPLTRKAT